MLKIDLTGSKKKMDEVLNDYDVEISKEIINCVCDGIDEGLSMVLVLQILLNGEIEWIDFRVTRSMYMEALEINIQPLINAEEYEFCAKAKKYIEILSGKYIDELIKTN